MKACADVLKGFDSWAGMLNKELYDEFCLPYFKQIIDSIDEVPVILFAKGAYFSLKDICQLGADVVGLDWTLSAESFRLQYGYNQVVQGNLDPCVLYSNEKEIHTKTTKMIDDFGKHHICNLGHGVYPDTPLDGVKTFINSVKSYHYSLV